MEKILSNGQVKKLIKKAKVKAQKKAVKPVKKSGITSRINRLKSDLKTKACPRQLQELKKLAAGRKFCICRREDLFTMTDLSIILSVPYNPLREAIVLSKRIPAPTHLSITGGPAGKKYYKKEDILKIMQLLEVK